ncbi:hypothetical protein HanPSC8_Chr01g0041531 [Helianthus annuus]|nr:hypothetical protein HanPSC8_Chr01g0041531 [Helianthus annuus]
MARSVSKAWKSVIDSPDFIADYTVHNHDQPHHLLIRYENLYSVETYVSFVDDDSFPQNKYSPTVPRSVNLLRDSIIIGTSLVLKSERRTKATRYKTKARSAKRKSGGLFVPEAQSDYITFYIYFSSFWHPLFKI